MEPGFTFLCRTTLVCAEISILFHWSTLDQKVNARSLGSFIGAPPTSQAGSPMGVVDCTIPNSPRSNITRYNFYGMIRRGLLLWIPLLSLKQGRFSRGFPYPFACLKVDPKAVQIPAPLPRDSPVPINAVLFSLSSQTLFRSERQQL